MKLENIKDREAAERTWPEIFNADPSAIFVTNGEVVLCNRFGQYQPNLCFVLNEENISDTWEASQNKYNINWDGDPEELIGDYWINKKGTKFFRPNKEGKHVLIRVGWGGSFNSTRGEEYNEIKNIAVYSVRASSKGGGKGCNYYVFDKNFRREVSIEDI